MMDENGVIKSLVLLLVPVAIGGSVFFMQGCGCGGPMGDYEEQEYILLEIEGQEWTEKILEQSDRYSYSDPDDPQYVGPDLIDEVFVENGYLVNLGRSERVQLPDSLSYCSVSHTPFTMLCTVTKQTELFNPNNGNRFGVQKGITKLIQIPLSSGGNPNYIEQQVLLADTAEFISAEKYRVSSFANPRQFFGSEEVYFQRGEETRKIVIDSAGTIVNDILFYSELKEMKLEGSEEQEIINFGSYTANQDLPEFTISPDRKRFAYSYKAKVFTGTFRDTARISLGRGGYPSFLNNGHHLLIRVDRRKYTSETAYTRIYEFSSQTADTLKNENRLYGATAHPSGNLVYFMTVGDGNYATLEQYNINTRERTVLFSAGEYVEYREEKEENIWITLDFEQIYLKSERPGDVFIRAESTYSYSYEC